jgi:hypothetical protein
MANDPSAIIHGTDTDSRLMNHNSSAATALLRSGNARSVSVAGDLALLSFGSSIRFRKKAVMPHPDHSAPPIVFLGENQVYRFYGLAADRVRVDRGRARLIEPPTWLAERMTFADRILAPGDDHTLNQCGWFTVEALADTKLHILPAPTPQSWLRRVLTRHDGLRRCP